MTTNYNTYAYFWVADFDCSPSAITETLGIKPTKTTTRNQSSQKSNYWELHSSLPRTEIFQDAHLSNLIENLLPKANEVRNLSKKYSIGINCVGYYTNTHPSFHMSAELIQQCASLNLSIDFDLYNLSEPV